MKHNSLASVGCARTGVALPGRLGTKGASCVRGATTLVWKRRSRRQTLEQSCLWLPAATTIHQRTTTVAPHPIPRQPSPDSPPVSHPAPPRTASVCATRVAQHNQHEHHRRHHRWSRRHRHHHLRRRRPDHDPRPTRSHTDAVTIATTTTTTITALFVGCVAVVGLVGMRGCARRGRGVESI